MKTLSAALEAHYGEEVTTISTQWKVTLTNGDVYGFTNHVEDIVYDGVTYLAAAGYTPSAIETSNAMDVDNLEVEGLLSSPAITEADLMAGKWDYAAVEIFELNYADLTMGKNILRFGKLGEVKTGRVSFFAEIRGMMQSYAQVIGELYQPICRARLGDDRCQQATADYTANGTVSGVTNNRSLTTDLGLQVVRLSPSSTGAPTDGYFDQGLLTWNTGLNAGLSIEVKSYIAASQTVEVVMAAPYAIAVGDTFSIVAGCLGRFTQDCKNKFGNVVNFRGEPHLPGLDQILKPIAG